MTMKRTYLDYNASAPLRREARAAMLSTLDAVGNPSSVHAEGRVARAIIETAREQVASLVNAKPSEVVFVSGATEANNWVLSAGWDAIALARFEHDSVTSPVAASGATRIDISISRNGVAKLEGVGEALAASAAASKRTLLTLMTANNETGVIQPVAEVAALPAPCGGGKLVRMTSLFISAGHCFTRMRCRHLGESLSILQHLASMPCRYQRTSLADRMVSVHLSFAMVVTCGC